MRQFTDRHGTRWEVFEVSHGTLSIGRADFLPPAFRTGWLAFDNGTERRRLAPFPSEWAAFSRTALQSLLDAAEPVGRAPRTRRVEQPTESAAPPPSSSPPVA